MTSLTDPFPSIDDLEAPLVPGADTELVALRRRGFEEGRAAGFEAGRFEGLARGAVEGRAEVAARVDAVLAELSRALDGADQSHTRLSAEILDLALAIAAAVLQREVVSSSNPGRESLLRAMTLVPDRTAIVAHLHPDDYGLLGDVGDLAPGREITLVPDPSIGRGECVVDAGAGRVDARFAPALERVRAALETSEPALLDGLS